MAKNLSVEQFQQLMERLPKAAAAGLHAGVFEQARKLSSAQAAAVAVDEGDLRASHRVEQGRRPLQALVKAGGPLTTHKVRAGYDGDYDHALANEFGTREMAARPAFWPTYRLMKKGIRSAIARRAKEEIGKVVPLK